MSDLAPIVLFTYNRPWHTEQTLNALMENDLAKDSVLYIYSDGCKDITNNTLLKEISEVREIIRKKKWCKNVYITISNENKGLAKSIISAVSEIVNRHGKVIVLEDDIVTSKGFLKYMNNALNFYQNEEKVMHISAYMHPHDQQLPETFFFEVPYPHGWATWRRSWIHFKDDASGLYSYFEDNRLWNSFNKFGGKLLQKQLKANVDGKLNTWFIKWHSAMVKKKGLTLYPKQSLTNNIGFDNSGVHCTVTSKFDIEVLAQEIQVNAIELKVSRKATRIIVRFYQGDLYYIKKIIIRLTPNYIKKYIKKYFFYDQT
jgi:hypothetical protein